MTATQTIDKLGILPKGVKTLARMISDSANAACITTSEAAFGYVLEAMSYGVEIPAEATLSANISHAVTGPDCGFSRPVYGMTVDGELTCEHTVMPRLLKLTVDNRIDRLELATNNGIVVVAYLLKGKGFEPHNGRRWAVETMNKGLGFIGLRMVSDKSHNVSIVVHIDDAAFPGAVDILDTLEWCEPQAEAFERFRYEATQALEAEETKRAEEARARGKAKRDAKANSGNAPTKLYSPLGNIVMVSTPAGTVELKGLGFATSKPNKATITANAAASAEARAEALAEVDAEVDDADTDN